MTVADLVATARRENRTVLTEVESKELIKAAGIPVVETRLARSKDEAVASARELGFPAVMKIVSPHIIHKSDVGGVKIGLKDEAEAARAYEEIMTASSQASPEARVDGVSVQPMANPGIEVIFGMSKDPQFGPVLMFGLGGVMVEVLKDVAFRIVPLTLRDAREMVREIKSFPLLEGYRGQEPAHIPTLEDTLLKLSTFVDRHLEIKELDLNPIFAYRDGLVAVDARVILEDEA